MALVAASFALLDAAGVASAQSSPIVQLTVVRSRSVVRTGDTATLQAFANLADGTIAVDVTSAVSWSSSTPGVGALTGNQATGIASGQTNVIATDPASGVQSDPAAQPFEVQVAGVVSQLK